MYFPEVDPGIVRAHSRHGFFNPPPTVRVEESTGSTTSLARHVVDSVLANRSTTSPTPRPGCRPTGRSSRRRRAGARGRDANGLVGTISQQGARRTECVAWRTQRAPETPRGSDCVAERVLGTDLADEERTLVWGCTTHSGPLSRPSPTGSPNSGAGVGSGSRRV